MVVSCQESLSNSIAKVRSALAGGMILLVAQGTSPATADDVATCRKAEGTPSIEACSRAIRADKQGGRGLASLYLNRGLVASKQNDVDRAIKDYSEAIRLAPTYALAWSNRCSAYLRKREPALALKDCDEADPT